MSKNREIGIDNIYIVHGITGYEQREQMLNTLLKEKNGLDFEFVTESEESEQNDKWFSQYFSNTIKEVLSKGALYCTLIHILIYERILRNNDKYAIVFENDVCFISDFPARISKIVKEANQLEEGFIISLENSTLKFPPLSQVKKGKYLYPAVAGRCAGAYMIDRQAVKNILEDLKNNKCSEVIDWWHNDLIKRNVIKMYWAHPPLTEQGSSNGVFNSSLSLNKNGFIRRARWEIQKFYKMYILRLIKVN